MLLSRLLQALPYARATGSRDVEVLDVAYDSRRVTPGTVFVAVPSVEGGPGGAQHTHEARERGAAAVVLEGGDTIEGVTTVHVRDARRALADLAVEYFGRPAERLCLYAVTGTDGKTTTTYLLEQILSAAGLRTGLLGTVEIKVGEDRRRNLDRMTTPESLDLQRLLRSMVDAGVTHAVMEASSHAVVLERLRGCRFAACGLTNIPADHIEFHGSWEAYFQAKARLFTELARGRPAVLNRDDRHFERLAGMIVGPIHSYGLGGDAEIVATDIVSDHGGSRFHVRVRDETVPMTVPLPGAFNVSNALAATGLALRAGLSLQEIARGISRAQPPPGRMERVSAGQPFEVVVDYAHTMHAFRTVLATMRDQTPAPRRVIAVFGATGDRDRSKRPVLARVAREYADFFIITNEDPYRERADAIIAEVASGVPRQEEGIRFRCEQDRERAIREAIRSARPGDTVVILGKGHEQSMMVNGRKEPWSDVAAVRRVLETGP